MRSILTIGIFTVLCLLPSTAAFAQFWPTYSGYYGGWGGYPYGTNATSRYVAESDRMMGQAAAMRQSAAMQGDIRNTLSSQAEARSQAILDQQQSSRDWWFQVQQQQMAQRHATTQPTGYTTPVAVEPPSPNVPQSVVATDVIKWLPVLCEPQFTEQRDRIEAPYRRVPKGDPTVADYREMMDAAGQMKNILKRMTADISAQDYLNAQAFLDQLIGEARSRIEKALPASPETKQNVK